MPSRIETAKFASDRDLLTVSLREMEARASKLANIIESNTASKAQTELENASDEEEKFSAVVRPSHDSPSSRDRHDSREIRDFNRSDRGSANAGGGNVAAAAAAAATPSSSSSSSSVNNSGGIFNCCLFIYR